MNNYELQEKFLENIKQIFISNPDKQIDFDFIYSYLSEYNVKPSQGLAVNIENKIKHLKKSYKKLLTVSETDKSFRFSKGPKELPKENIINISVPLDINHIEDGADQILDYMVKNQSNYMVVINKTINNNNIRISVNSMEDAAAVINYLKKNDYINEGVLAVNPFMPNINGFGITMNSIHRPYPYDVEVASLIGQHFSSCMLDESLDKFNIVEFNKYVSTCCDYVKDDDLKDIFHLISQTTTPNFELQDFTSLANNKFDDKVSSNNEGDFEVLISAYISTLNEYGEEQAKGALKALLLNGSLGYFTNKLGDRDKLSNLVGETDIEINTLKLILNNIDINNLDVNDIDEIVNRFSNVVNGMLNNIKQY